MSAETDFWIPATKRALAEWEVLWRKLPPPMGMQSSSFFVDRMRSACDIQNQLLDAAVNEVIERANGCVLSSDIQNERGTALGALEPIARKRIGAITAQKTDFSARGNHGQTLDTVAYEANRQAARGFDAAVHRLQVALEQRKRQLVLQESEKAERRTDRSQDVRDRRRKELIDLGARVVQLVAALGALANVKSALIFSLLIGAVATIWTATGRGGDF